MRAPVVDRDDFDILMIPASVELFVFDPQVREMNLVVEVREVVVARPFLYLVRLAIGPTAALLAVSIPLVQPSLILALELVVEDDSFDACVALGEPLRLLQIGVVDLAIMLDLARLHEAGVELLAVVLMTLVAMGVENISTAVRQDDDVLSMTVQPLSSDEPFFSEMSQVA
jgi:hypothetical protein